MFSNMEANNVKRGVMLYVKKNLKPSILSTTGECEEAVWAEVKLNKSDRLILGVIYRSPNSTPGNDNDLRKVLLEISEFKASHILMMGDFNHPEINWENDTTLENQAHPSSKFRETLRDCYMHQHVTQPTHYRSDQTPNTLDLVLTNEPDMVNAIEHNAPLGKSHHCVLNFTFNCYFVAGGNQRPIPMYDKADFVQMRKELGEINWRDQLQGMTVNEAWCYTEKKMKDIMKKYIPQKHIPTNRSCRKPLYMDSKALSRVKKKKH